MKIPNDVAEKISKDVTTIIEVALFAYPSQEDGVEKFQKWLITVGMTAYLKGWSEACRKELHDGILTKIHEFVKSFEKNIDTMVAEFGNFSEKHNFFRHRNDGFRDKESKN